jgi:hypothetical protein
MSTYTLRPTPDEYAPFFGGYIHRVPPGDLVTILRAQITDTLTLFRNVPEPRGDYAYATGKWTIKEVIGHLCDVERVMSYRALRFARADSTPLAAFDENTYAPEGRFGARSIKSLTDEFAAVRNSTVALFDGLPAEAWPRTGTASGNPLSVRAVACIIAGHERHHLEILRNRYSL